MIKISEAWLREWCDAPLNTLELVEKLTSAGLEIEGVEAVAPAFSGVMVGYVQSVERHPHADRLQVCQVQLATDQDAVTIVCGAPNVAAGQKVAVATPGAILPGDFHIAERAVRKITSHGMLCSQAELGLVDQAEAIWVLADDAPLGADLRVYLQYNDQMLLTNFTPNRGDCLSARGLAREVAALTGNALRSLPNAPAVVTIQSQRQIKIIAEQACWNYCGRVIENINPHAQTPWWMKEKLRRSGIRCVHPAVDVTQYMLLELGQPLHAFDLNQLQGDLQVRFATQGETLTVLDGRELSLKSDTLIIADQSGPTALAGVMGGHTSRVTENTQAIFLECACFAPTAIAGQARAYGLQSDAAHRFERGVDPQLQRVAIEMATNLLLEIMGGDAGPITQVQSQLAACAAAMRSPIQLTVKRLHSLLGFEFPLASVEPILQGLGCSLQVEAGVAACWLITPPSFRFDIQRDVDLIEELVRVYGYDHVPARVPVLPLQVQQGPQWAAAQTLQQAQTLLVDLGYSEAITYSFVDPALQDALLPKAFVQQSLSASTAINPFINVLNPISADLAQMRASLWVGLLKAVEHNQKRQIESLKLFESGLTFLRSSDLPSSELLSLQPPLPESSTSVASAQFLQQPYLAGVWAGNLSPLNWQSKSVAVDFFAIKGDVERLLVAYGLKESVSWQTASHPALHPGQSARLSVGDQTLGWVGQVHPSVLKAFDLQGAVFVFELSLNLLLTQQRTLVNTGFVEVSRFPEIRRDVAMMLPVSQSVAALKEVVTKLAIDILREQILFDVYQGPGMAEGMQSVAVALYFQHRERTLTELEVDAALDVIKTQWVEQLNAVIRV